MMVISMRDTTKYFYPYLVLLKGRNLWDLENPCAYLLVELFKLDLSTYSKLLFILIPIIFITTNKE